MIKTRNSCQWIFCILLMNLLSGCQVFQRQQVDAIHTQSQQQQQLALASLNHWQAKGKFIFKGPQEKFSVSLNWSQQNNKADIRLTSFLGISKLKMLIDENFATLTSEGRTVTSNNPESLLLKTTGITLPVNDSSRWMKGAIDVGNPHNHKILLDSFHRVKQIQLLDTKGQPWQIDYQGYLNVGTYQLPKKIRLSGNGIVVIIKISDWDLLTSKGNK